ncbi:hypothetical protein M5K25_019637 [Dendrobium thyrsiflorum]|uniref:Uncharacterized protein n=1 Tax=Dendrobium thyrsiflorum TaxID=117978 RepID=A0ABD0UFF2_DENTH
MSDLAGDTQMDVDHSDVMLIEICSSIVIGQMNVTNHVMAVYSNGVNVTSEVLDCGWASFNSAMQDSEIPVQRLQDGQFATLPITKLLARTAQYHPLGMQLSHNVPSSATPHWELPSASTPSTSSCLIFGSEFLLSQPPCLDQPDSAAKATPPKPDCEITMGPDDMEDKYGPWSLVSKRKNKHQHRSQAMKLASIDGAHPACSPHANDASPSTTAAFSHSHEKSSYGRPISFVANCSPPQLMIFDAGTNGLLNCREDIRSSYNSRVGKDRISKAHFDMELMQSGSIKPLRE